jgi:hypothetical protein
MPKRSLTPWTINTGARRWPKREGEAEDAGGAGLGRGAAGDTGAGRAAADEQRYAAQLLRMQLLDDGDPGGVELPCGRRGATAGDAVGLLDECDADPQRERRLGRGDEVGRRDATARAVPEHERAARSRDAVHVRAGRPVRRGELADGDGGGGHRARASGRPSSGCGVNRRGARLSSHR